MNEEEKQNYPTQLFPIRTPPKHSFRYSEFKLKGKAQNNFKKKRKGKCYEQSTT